MDSKFIDILKKLIEEQGKEALLSPAKCKGLLADYTHGEYKKERDWLILAVDAGVSKTINGTDDLVACKKEQIGELEEEKGLKPTVAADIVNALALVLRGDKTMTVYEGDLVNEEQERRAKKERQERAALQNCIATGFQHTVGLKADGTVVAVGSNTIWDGNLEKEVRCGQCNTGRWRGIVAIAAATNHTVGLKADGTVVAVGENDDGRCNTGSWRDIVAVAAGWWHTVGLKADGTVVAVGFNDDGQLDNTGSWRGIGKLANCRLITA